jgi:hypothetical protein
MNAQFFLRLIAVSCLLAGLPAVGASAIGSLPISVNYSGSASVGGSVAQTADFQASVQDFIALGPDSLPLFDVSAGANQISITALRSFTIQPNGFMDFNWVFALPSADGLSFSGANLVSSSLFSIPPFTFAVNPPVSFDPATQTISVGGFIADGIGCGTVNDGGAAVIDFTVIPEPPVWAWLTLGAGISLVSGSRAKAVRRRTGKAAP